MVPIRYSISDRFLRDLIHRLTSLLSSLERNSDEYVALLRLIDALQFVVRNPQFYQHT